MKSLLIKYSALFISICYLAAPLHNEIGNLFHDVSHFFEAPITVLNHKGYSSHSHVVHSHHEHTHASTEHKHSIIDFVNSLFDADSTNEEAPISKFVKLDKHLTFDEIVFHNSFIPAPVICFAIVEEKIKKGYFIILLEPPKPSFIS
ncbi:hypothetical protein [Pseudozobellia sp. WGM2]|uniref:hypothetical protein n=1 Tax=Pseudozobellia sp. WGM2 TaxID=2787625 RepID=UPI001ADF9562|nr:hypothetical protein [Pseudozobellia sp. WGM2]